jgi:hypothetical protein
VLLPLAAGLIGFFCSFLEAKREVASRHHDDDDDDNRRDDHHRSHRDHRDHDDHHDHDDDELSCRLFACTARHVLITVMIRAVTMTAMTS